MWNRKEKACWSYKEFHVKEHLMPYLYFCRYVAMELIHCYLFKTKQKVHLSNALYGTNFNVHNFSTKSITICYKNKTIYTASLFWFCHLFRSYVEILIFENIASYSVCGTCFNKVYYSVCWYIINFNICSLYDTFSSYCNNV